MYEHAHKLNDHAGYFYTQALALAAGDLELIARNARLDEAQSVLAFIEREITRTLAS